MDTVNMPTDVLRPDGRSAIEVLIKALVALLTASVSARSLSRLRKKPSGLANYEFLTTLILPTYSLAAFLVSAVKSLQMYRKYDNTSSTRYYLGVALDQRAESLSNEMAGKEMKKELGTNTAGHPSNTHQAEESIPLSVVSPKTPQASSSSLDIRHMFGPILLFTHALLTSVSYFHRTANNARTFLDDFIFLFSLSTLINSLVSFALTVQNTTWYVPNHYITKFYSLRSEHDIIDLFYFSKWGDPPEMVLGLVLATAFQSFCLLFLKQRGTGLETGALSCDNWFLSWYIPHYGDGDQTWMLTSIPPSHNLSEPWPLPCHTGTGSDWDLVLRILIDMIFTFSFIMAWLILVPIFRFLLGMIFKMHKTISLRPFLTGHQASVLLGIPYTMMWLGMGFVTVWNLLRGEKDARWRWRDPWMASLWVI